MKEVAGQINEEKADFSLNSDREIGYPYGGKKAEIGSLPHVLQQKSTTDEFLEAKHLSLFSSKNFNDLG